MSKPFYLTFDGAPNPPGTDRILKVLKAWHKGTFYGRETARKTNCALRFCRQAMILVITLIITGFFQHPLEACIEK